MVRRGPVLRARQVRPRAGKRTQARPESRRAAGTAWSGGSPPPSHSSVDSEVYPQAPGRSRGPVDEQRELLDGRLVHRREVERRPRQIHLPKHMVGSRTGSGSGPGTPPRAARAPRRASRPRASRPRRQGGVRRRHEAVTVAVSLDHHAQPRRAAEHGAKDPRVCLRVLEVEKLPSQVMRRSVGKPALRRRSSRGSAKRIAVPPLTVRIPTRCLVPTWCWSECVTNINLDSVRVNRIDGLQACVHAEPLSRD